MQKPFVLEILTNFFISRQKEGWAALWAVPLFETSFSNKFLFFRGILKLTTYIILLLHETNQRPLRVLGRRCCKTYWLIWNQISTMSLSVYALFAYMSVTGYLIVISD